MSEQNKEMIELLEKARNDDLKYTHDDSCCDCHCCRAIDKIDIVLALLRQEPAEQSEKTYKIQECSSDVCPFKIFVCEHYICRITGLDLTACVDVPDECPLNEKIIIVRR